MKTFTLPAKCLLGAVAAAGLCASSLQAGEPSGKAVAPPMPPAPEPWTICNLFEYNTPYEADTGFIREISFHGRYHGQYFIQDEEIGGADNDFEGYQHRRTRLALEVAMAYGLTFYGEVNIADGDTIGEGPFVNDFEALYLEWEQDAFWFRVGKQKQNFTIEDTESSKRIKSVERSAIVNETAGARPWGAVFGFDLLGMEHAFGGWLYGGHEDSPQLIDFDSNGGFSYNATLPLAEHTDLRFDYVYADNNGGSEGTEGPAANGYGPEYEHAYSLGTESQFGPFGLIINGVGAQNRSGGGGIPDGNDTWGAYVLPSYDVTDDFELVFRYGYMDEGREQRPQRYDLRAPVSNYHTFYGGFQYFICKDKLKVMAGYEYATGDIYNSSDDIETGTWQFAVRTYF
jgi:hypothetical protein